jgi:hypothetical protein
MGHPTWKGIDLLGAKTPGLENRQTWGTRIYLRPRSSSKQKKPEAFAPGLVEQLV